MASSLCAEFDGRDNTPTRKQVDEGMTGNLVIENQNYTLTRLAESPWGAVLSMYFLRSKSRNSKIRYSLASL